MKKLTHILTIFLFAVLILAWNISATAQTPTVTVLQPSDAGISWARGTTHLISWSGNLTKPVKIELWKDGKIYTTLSSSTTGSTYSWYINPSTIPVSTKYQINIVSTTNSSVSDISDHYFSITKTNPNPTIHVLQPSDAGISWARGTTHLISWNDNLTESVKIELWKDGQIYTTLSSSKTGSTYSWYINPSLPVSTKYQINIVSTKDGTVSDISDHYFSITKTNPAGTITVLQPSDAGISWARGTTHLISWNDNLTEPVKIELWKDGKIYTTLSSSKTGSTYSWYINPSTIPVSTKYQINIVSTKDGTVSDISDHYFSITLPAKIDVYPNPTTNFVTVKVNDNNNKNYVVTLYNRFGVRQATGMINTNVSKELRLSTLNLPKGIYFISVTGGPKKISKMIIVQH